MDRVFEMYDRDGTNDLVKEEIEWLLQDVQTNLQTDLLGTHDRDRGPKPSKGADTERSSFDSPSFLPIASDGRSLDTERELSARLAEEMEPMMLLLKEVRKGQQEMQRDISNLQSVQQRLCAKLDVPYEESSTMVVQLPQQIQLGQHLKLSNSAGTASVTVEVQPGMVPGESITVTQQGKLVQ